MEETKKPWICSNGWVYVVPANYCVFCKHCTDIFYDDSHGPYMCFCGIDPNNEYETCGRFESDEEDEE